MDILYTITEKCICGRELQTHKKYIGFGEVIQYTKGELTPHFCEDCDKIYGNAQRELMETY